MEGEKADGGERDSVNSVRVSVSLMMTCNTQGFVPTLLEDVPDMAVKFAVYESLRSLHQRVFRGRPATILEDLIIGGTAGAAAAAATTPLDVIKTVRPAACVPDTAVKTQPAAVCGRSGPCIAGPCISMSSMGSRPQHLGRS